MINHTERDGEISPPTESEGKGDNSRLVRAVANLMIGQVVIERVTIGEVVIERMQLGEMGATGSSRSVAEQGPLLPSSLETRLSSASESRDDPRTQLSEKNRKALEKLREALTALQNVGEGNATADDKRNLVLQELNLRERIAEHLKAAATVVQPLSPQTLAQLEKLASKLDNAIIIDASINATLKFATTVLHAAREIGGIINEHAPSG